MKYLKMLGLAAIAAGALMAFVGASTASATVLCETNVTSNCGSAWSWANGSTVTFSLAPGASAKLKDPIFGTTINTCTASSVSGAVTNGSSTTTPNGTAHGTFTECTKPVSEATDGTIEIHSISGSDQGTVTANGFAFTFEDPFGHMCAYGFNAATDIGNFVPGTNGLDGTLNINHAVSLIAAHSDEGCISSGTWTANYTQTGSTPLYISAS